jgi:transposase
MLKQQGGKPTELEFVSIDELVPGDHLLRKVERAVDFSFIRERVAGLYCADNGRPAIDPVILFKMLVIGYLFGIRSERQLVRDIQVNVAYRWFLGLTLKDKVPDASTLSQNRRRRPRRAEPVLPAQPRRRISRIHPPAFDHRGRLVRSCL